VGLAIIAIVLAFPRGLVGGAADLRAGLERRGILGAIRQGSGA
jgi:hypothetical protein